ncbi:hypothetical protein Har1130_16095 [Haloarcula sp. CBA1130]|uniref:hypothetical protein n=1 Tax=unclassified Haloarcula TaxID=2624677 RepID=UPI001246DA95|nr:MULTISPECIES: hypothetical protein [unclassified Haloarcula]KAA9396192.1 hypothetical protein Har1129_20150 [Haloarcula sp. CBA1129]KAA9400279.1 hypothetical protein Har1130_16095 [Haloarcula sp. CBA1130]
MSGRDEERSKTVSSVGYHSQTARRSTLGVLTSTLGRIRRDPVLAVPFAVAGVLVALGDWLRRHDPIPTASTDALSESLSVTYSVLPQGTARTVRHVGALVGLKTRYLLWAVGLEVLIPLAVGIAGWMTIARTLDTRSPLRALCRYLIALAAVVSIPQLLGGFSIDVNNVLLGLVLLAMALFVMTRLFLLPALLVTGSGFVTALRQSYRHSRGQGLLLAGLIIVIGLAYWGLATVPVAGGFLSTAVVAPIHAVAIGTVFLSGPHRTPSPPVEGTERGSRADGSR